MSKRKKYNQPFYIFDEDVVSTLHHTDEPVLTVVMVTHTPT